MWIQICSVHRTKHIVRTLNKIDLIPVGALNGGFYYAENARQVKPFIAAVTVRFVPYSE